MGLTIGPATWHPDYIRYLACTTALGCPLLGGFLFSKADGIACIVAPYSTQVTSTWAGGQYNSTVVGNKCCISEWSGLQTALTDAGLTPSQWFVPSASQLVSAYACRTFWGNTNPCWTGTDYWSSTEANSNQGCNVFFGNGGTGVTSKSSTLCTRAFRCVTF